MVGCGWMVSGMGDQKERRGYKHGPSIGTRGNRLGCKRRAELDGFPAESRLYHTCTRIYTYVKRNDTRKAHQS